MARRIVRTGLWPVRGPRFNIVTRSANGVDGAGARLRLPSTVDALGNPPCTALIGTSGLRGWQERIAALADRLRQSARRPMVPSLAQSRAAALDEYEAMRLGWLETDPELANAIVQAKAGLLRGDHPLAALLGRRRSPETSAVLIATSLVVAAAVPALAFDIPRLGDAPLPDRKPGTPDDTGITLIQGFRLPDGRMDDAGGPVMPVATGAPAWSTDIRAAFGDGDQFHGLSYSATLQNGSPLPGWLRIDPASGILQVAPGPADSGTFRVKVTARDATGAEVSQLLVLSVSGGTAALVFASAPEAAAQFSDVQSALPLVSREIGFRPPAFDFNAHFERGLIGSSDEFGSAPPGNNATSRGVDKIAEPFVPNRAPTITSPNALTVAENTSGPLYTVAATDPDPRTVLTYSLQGVDAGLFTIDSRTGVVTFRSAPDFEAPADANGDNVYDLLVVASDGQVASFKPVRLTVTNRDEPLTGSVAIVGTPIENGTLAADTSGLVDPDGITAISYQWLRNGAAISGATGSTYTLGDADVGRAISVRISYTDGAGGGGTLTSPVTGPVSNVNDAPTGGVSIAGTATEDAVLTADTSSLADADGLGPLSYQWLRDGVAITGATGTTYTLGDADVGRSISVRVSYTDGHGTAQSVTSTPTSAVANVNDAPQGGVFITGSVTQGATLTADTASLSDADGLGAPSYQWLRDGNVIAGATASTYTLGNVDVGAAISVRVTYTDGRGATETVTSVATSAVTNQNDAPTGGVSITGSATEDATLTADTSTLADDDGLGVLSYQWLRNGAVISGATGSTYTLGDADVGATISVRVTYMDGGGTAETLTSVATSAVTNVNDAPQGDVFVIGSVTQGATLTADTASLSDADGLGAPSYQWLRDGTVIAGATASTYTLGNGDVGAAISVRVTYTDGLGTTETVTSAATNAVTNQNDAPTGGVSITGSATEDATLTADTSTLADDDGLGVLSYQWLRNGVVISGATGPTYTLGDADVGKSISVRVSYTDGGGTSETLTSAATSAIANVNDAPTGGVSISGTATEDAVLTADTSNLADIDGLGPLSYQWLRNGAAITGATGSTYTLRDADVGKSISVMVSYTDGGGTLETLISAPTSSVANINDAPKGGVSIAGTATEDAVLTADASSLADADGLGPLSYQWLRDGVAITGATGTTYTLGDADVGKSISVRVSYTDDHGAAQSVTSTPTSAVANVNDAPQGGVFITGSVTQGATLTADTASLSDADGLGAPSYQWLRDGNVIAGATSSTYTLVNADVGAAISVRVTYTDGRGTTETVTSVATSAVTNQNDAPTGGVSITGSATEDATLTADTSTLADDDGLGVLSYQWLRNGAVISGATAATYTLGDADVGATISVRVTYTDGGGTVETLTSAATSAVANVNDAPSNLVVSGTLSVQELVADGGTSGVAFDPSGAVVATFSATDVDPGDTLTYSIVNDASGFFEIIGNALVVKAGAQLDYETATSHVVTVAVTDAAGASIQTAVTISIVDFEQTITLSSAFSFLGSSEEDSLTGSAGHDGLYGSSGDDTLIGGDGNDWITGGLNNDLLFGGGGNDSYDFSHALAGAYVAIDTSGSAIVTIDLTDFDTISGFENIYGGFGNDTLIGNEFSNTLVGGLGDDSLTGNASANTLSGGAGNDTLNGGAGLDTADFTYATANVTLTLDGAGDALATIGGGERDALLSIENVLGGSGNDSLVGNASDNILSGATGNDVLSGGGGNDSLAGDAGVDTVSYAYTSTGVSVTLGASGEATVSVGLGDIDTLAAIENIIGGSGNDTITGNNASNTFMGGAGNDVLHAGGGSAPDTVDYSYASTGISVLLDVGGSGVVTVSPTERDTITFFENVIGGSGDDTITANGANNVLMGRGGNDLLTGGAGSDTADYSYASTGIAVTLTSLGAATVTVVFGTDVDTLSEFENVIGGSGADTLSGNAFDNVLTGGLGNDVLDGGTGNDTASYAYTTSNLVLAIDSNGGAIVSVGATDVDTLSGIENLTGGWGNDIIIGNDGANVLSGGEGADILYGGAGNDTLVGGNQHDSLFGGAGADSIDGQGNADTVMYVWSAVGVNVNLRDGLAESGGDAQGDTLTSIEHIWGSYTAGDTLTGGIGPNDLFGWGGDDLLSGAEGNDALYGGSGSDTASYAYTSSAVSITLDAVGSALVTASLGADVDLLHSIENLIGGSGNDSLTGNASANSLTGGLGDDTLAGGLGDDFLFGGTGSDTFHFVFAAGQSWGVDTIASFDDGFDMIRVDVPVPGDITGLTFGDYFEIVTVGSDTLVTIKSGGPLTGNGESILIQNVTAPSITFADFTFI